MKRKVLWRLYKRDDLTKVAEVYEATLRGEPVYRYTIFGANGEKMAASEPYPEVRNARRGVDDIISRLSDATSAHPFVWKEAET